MIKLYEPQLEDLWFRKKFTGDDDRLFLFFEE